MVEISTVLAESPASAVPGVRIVGLVVGLLLLVAAIRGMFGRRGR